MVEFLLWLGVGWFSAVVYFQEAWLAALPLAGMLGAILAVNRGLAAPGRSWPRGLGFALVFPLVWSALQLFSYGMLLVWSRILA